MVQTPLKHLQLAMMILWTNDPLTKECMPAPITTGQSRGDELRNDIGRRGQ
jgi:hypothetical protein